MRRQLICFSNTAGEPPVPAAHPRDRSVWFRFLTRLHRRRRHPDELAFLLWFLIQHGFSKTRATALVQECQFARSLLESYDGFLS